MPWWLARSRRLMVLSPPLHLLIPLRGLEVGVVLSVLSSVAGCVTLTPQQRDTVADVQRFADATADAYKLLRIPVTVEPSTNLGIGGRYRQGNFYLNVETLNSGHLTALVAHELAHYVLGHEPLVSGSSTAEFQKAQELRELDANAKAVEILVRVKSMTQPQALRTIVIWLRTAQSSQARGRPNAPGHRPPAEEIADLLARFPGLDRAGSAPNARTGPSSSAEPILAPTWKPGDEWTFWWESPRGSGTFVWSVEREEIIDGTAYYVVKSGTTREIYYQKADLAWRMDMVSGAIETKATPAQLRFVWPLTIGRSWEQTVATERAKSPTETKTRACRVTGEETVTVAGGTYSTIKTVCRDTATAEVIYQTWYAPEVKHWVKEWSRFPWGVQERELMAVKLR
jgi:hypothetical protein